MTTDPASETQRSIWVRTQAYALSRGYVCTVSYGEDHERALTPDEADAYVRTVLAAAARAEYDAAIMAQMSDVTGVGRAAAATLVLDVRRGRVRLDQTALAPMYLDPVVNPHTGKAGLVIQIGGDRLGMWSPRDAREHAMHIISAVAGADLDNAYYRALISIGIDPDRAERIIDDLRNYKGDDED